MYIDLGRQPHNEFSMECTRSKFRGIIDTMMILVHGSVNRTRFRSIVSALPELETAKSGMVDYWRTIVHATIDKHAFETFSTSERVVRKMSRQKRKKEKKEEKKQRKKRWTKEEHR